MKNLLRILALAAVLALCLATAALADGATVTVNGSAQVNAPTDHAVIRLGITTRAETPSQAQAENNERAEEVMKALTEAVIYAVWRVKESAPTMVLRCSFKPTPHLETNHCHVLTMWCLLITTTAKK